MRKKYKRQLLIISICISIITLFVYILLHYPKPSKQEPIIKLYLHEDDIVISMKLEEYIKGTVAAEMPASFGVEALKAQAVCARTYTIKKLSEHHPYPKGADLSDDVNTCQAFISVSNFEKNPDVFKQINKAVNSTRGEVMLFDSKPIDALYHSTCGGQTESADAVWGREIPYLRSVKCDDCKHSPHYRNTIVIKNETINKIAGNKGSLLTTKILNRTTGGRPKIIAINQHQIDSTELRKKLNLPSNWVEFKTSDDDTTITTHGYGHGVGLCQYGADGMAKRGKNYHQILKKYYNGINFYKIGY
jgi:stage II sporulation protein D